MARAMISPKFYAWDRNGKPLAFGKVYTYQARTNTPKPTYHSEDQIVPNTNPVILSGEGYADIYLDGSYKIVVKDSNDNEIWTADPVTQGGGDGGDTYSQFTLTGYYSTPTKVEVLGDYTSAMREGVRITLTTLQDSGRDKEQPSTIVSSSFDGDKTAITITDPLVTPGVKSVSVTNWPFEEIGAIEEFVESNELTFQTPQGQTKETITGIERKVFNQVASIPLGDGQWAAGKVYEAYNEYLNYGGIAYKPAMDTPLPYTTQGNDPTVAPDAGIVVPFAEVTRSDVVLNVSSISELLSVQPTGDDFKVNVTAYHDGWAATNHEPKGGGVFVWDSSRPKSDHNGGTIIDSDAPFPVLWGEEAQQSAWFSSSNAGSGCFVKKGVPELCGFGVTQGDDDQFEAVQAFFKASAAFGRGFSEIPGLSINTSKGISVEAPEDLTLDLYGLKLTKFSTDGTWEKGTAYTLLNVASKVDDGLGGSLNINGLRISGEGMPYHVNEESGYDNLRRSFGLRVNGFGKVCVDDFEADNFLLGSGIGVYKFTSVSVTNFKLLDVGQKFLPYQDYTGTWDLAGDAIYLAHPQGIASVKLKNGYAQSYDNEIGRAGVVVEYSDEGYVKTDLTLEDVHLGNYQRLIHLEDGGKTHVHWNGGGVGGFSCLLFNLSNAQNGLEQQALIENLVIDVNPPFRYGGTSGIQNFQNSGVGSSYSVFKNCRIHYLAEVQDRGAYVIDGGYVKLDSRITHISDVHVTYKNTTLDTTGGGYISCVYLGGVLQIFNSKVKGPSSGPTRFTDVRGSGLRVKDSDFYNADIRMVKSGNYGDWTFENSSFLYDGDLQGFRMFRDTSGNIPHILNNCNIHADSHMSIWGNSTPYILESTNLRNVYPRNYGQSKARPSCFRGGSWSYDDSYASTSTSVVDSSSNVPVYGVLFIDLTTDQSVSSTVSSQSNLLGRGNFLLNDSGLTVL